MRRQRGRQVGRALPKGVSLPQHFFSRRWHHDLILQQNSRSEKSSDYECGNLRGRYSSACIERTNFRLGVVSPFWVKFV